MMDRRLRRMVRPLTRTARAAADRWDALAVRRRADRLLQGSDEWQIGTVHRARSGTRIAQVRSARDGRAGILKITDAPDGALGLDREWTVLSALAAEPRLEVLRPLLPEVLAAGSGGGWSYLVQGSLAGAPATAGAMRAPRSLLTEASMIAGRMHGATATPRMITESEVDEWIGRPLAAVRSLVGDRLGTSEMTTLDRMAGELEAGVIHATIPLGWIHGDLWSDNILVDGPGGAITGIVDWDSASDAGLAAHDQLHLVLYTRKLLAGTEIGLEICRALGTDPEWDALEVAALETGTAHLPGATEAARRRLGILLYWLRLVEMNLARQPRATHTRRWVDDNIRAVLTCG
jgi:aminoglycoside phosphotransferase (APT) family kinase protein